MTDIVVIAGARHVVWQCRTCGVFATVPEVVNEQLRQCGGFRSCPSGHQWGWTKESSENERTRLERDRLKQNEARLEEDVRHQRERAEKAEAAARRLKKRASSGTCPCCSRTFQNMATHMKRQHPEFVRDGGTKVVPFKAERA